MMTIDQKMKLITERPTLHVLPSQFCQLRCPYCSNPRVVHVKNNAMHIFYDKDFRQLVENLPPSNILISGGEPLLGKGIGEFVSEMGSRGHICSIDTNLAVGEGHLKKLLDQWNPDHTGYLIVTHHLQQILDRKPATWDKLYNNTKLLKEAGILFFVDYVGIPGTVPRIKELIDRWTDVGISSFPTMLHGGWQGKRYPSNYTNADFLAFMEMQITYHYAMHFLEGFQSYGTPCKGGSEFASYSLQGNKKMVPCCHMGTHQIDITSTVFGGAPAQLLPCKNKGGCYGATPFILPHHKKDIDNWTLMLSHTPRRIEPGGFIEYCEYIQSKGMQIKNVKRYNYYKDNFLK